MAKVKTTTILLALMVPLLIAPSANALSSSTIASIPDATASRRPPQHFAIDCPACGKPMVRVRRKINGVWVWVWFCPEPTCN